MALRYVLDEHLRGPLWRAIQWHNSSGVSLLDVVRVGDPADLSLGSGDPALLLWAKSEQRSHVTQAAVRSHGRARVASASACFGQSSASGNGSEM